MSSLILWMAVNCSFLSIILVLSVDLRFLNWSQDFSPLMRRSVLVQPVMGWVLSWKWIWTWLFLIQVRR